MIKVLKKREFKTINYLLGIFIFIGFLIIIISFTQAIEEVNSIFLGEISDKKVLNASIDSLNIGKNIVIFDDYINVGDLIDKNPKIETVSYYDEFNDETVGYVNFFGGIGKEFVIMPGKEYEIFVNDEINLNL